LGRTAVLAFTDEGVARLLIAATAYTRDGDRAALLRKFSYLAERSPPERDQVWKTQLRVAAQRSLDAERMRRYRARLKRGTAVVVVTIGGAISLISNH
jgi:hypothetical protein